MMDNQPGGRPDGQAPAAEPARARWPRKKTRRLLWLVVCSIGLGLLAHAPFVRGWVLNRVTSWVGARHGLVISATGLHYNLLRLTASIDECRIRIGAQGEPSEPVVAVRNAKAVFGWGILRGRLDVRTLDADDVAVKVERAAFGALVASGAASRGVGEPSPSRPIEIPDFTAGQIDIHRLAFEYVDPDGVGRLAVRGGSLHLTGGTARHLEGPFGVESVSLDNNTVRVRAGRLEGLVFVDGDAVAIKPNRIDVGSDTLRGVGQVTLTGPAAGWDLHLEGSFAPQLFSEWLPALPGGQGRVLAKARVTGSVAEPSARLNVETSGLTWPGLALPRTSAEAVVSGGGIEIVELTVSSPPARLVASGELRFGDEAKSLARLRWDGVSPAVVVRMLRTRPPVAPPVHTSGTAALTWVGLVPSLATLGGTVAGKIVAQPGHDEAGTLRVSATPRQWHIEAERALPGGTARLDALLTPNASRFSRSAVHGSFNVTTDDARPVLEGVHRLGGPDIRIPAAIERLGVEISAKLSGSVGRPSAIGRARTPGLAVTDVGTLTADLAFESSLEALTIERLQARDERGDSIGARGTLAYHTLSSSGSFEVTASTKVFEGRLPKDWSAAGSIDARGTWGGTLHDPVAEVRFTGQKVALNGLSPVPLTATARVAGGVATVETSVGDLGAKARGELTLSEPFSFKASAQLENADLARLATLAPARDQLPSIQGAVTAGAEISGALHQPDLLSSRVHLERLDARVGEHPLVLVTPADIRVSQSEMSVAGLQLRSGDATLAADGRLDRAGTGALGLTVDTSAAEVALWLSDIARGTRITADGTVHVETRATGQLGAPSLEGRASVTLEQVTAGDRKVAENVRAGIELQGNSIEASRITGTVLGGTLDVSASAPTAWIARYLPASLGMANAPGGSAHVKGRIVVPVTSLLAPQGPNSTGAATGSITASIDASAPQPSLDAVAGTVTIEADQVTAQDVRLSLARPVILAVRAGRVSVEDAELRAPGASFAISGHADLTGPFNVDLRLAGSGSLGFVGGIVRGRTMGRLAADLRVFGPVFDPGATGTVTLEQAGIVLPAYRISFTDWSGRVEVTSEALTALDVSGQVNGGTAVMRGRLPLAPGIREASTLSLSVRDAFVEVVKGFKSQVDADLAVEHLADAFRVGGTVTVASGAYREPVTAMMALFSGAGRSAPARTAGRTAFDRVSFDVRLVARAPIIVDNSLGRVDLAPDMRLTGTVARPALSGSLDALKGGRLALAGRNYRILEGQAVFTPREGWLPRVNLSCETRVGDYTINVRAHGPVDAIETSATSTPPLSDRDLRSLLVTGRTTSLSGTSQDDEQFALEAVSSGVLGFAGQMVGLDSLQVGRADFDIGATDVKPATRLTVTKSLRERFRVILSENLDDNKLTWIIILDSGRGYEFRFSQRDEGEHVVEFRQELEFGPGTSPKGAPARVAAASATVSAVVFSGTPGMPASKLQEIVTTRAGGTFDVEAWQRDRERLETFYRKEGYATSRVVPRRTVTDTGQGERVEIEYHIDRGPRTLLRIEGLSLPDAVVEDIIAAWSEAVLPEFLRDESIRLVRRHLAEENRLQPSVEFSFDQPSDTIERVTLCVSPGPAVRSKQVVFEGKVSDADIKARASLRAALNDAWVNTAALLDEVQALYRDRGYFGARAIADPVAFEGDTARLNIKVIEGPQARVERVEFAGVNAARLERVRTSAQMEPGTIYLPGSARDARTRVLDAYRDLGYRSADLRVTPTIGGDGAVAVNFAVSEGPQSIVTAVRVEGAQATRPASIADAVTLRPGAPAGHREASETRNRLYGMGVFRSADVQFEPTAGGKGLAEEQVPVEAVVSLSEVRKYQLRYGLQLTDKHGSVTEDLSSAIGVAGDLRDRNFLGRGITIGATGSYDRDLQSSRGMLFLPRHVNQRLDSHLFATWRKERQTDAGTGATLDDTTRDVTFEQRFLVKRRLEVSWSYSYNHREFVVGSTTLTADQVTFPGTLASLQAGVVIDHRDSPFDASRGWFHSQNFQWGIPKLGSDVSYIRYLVRQYGYLPLGPLVLASGVRWGTLGHVKGTPPLSIADLFFDAGGSQTVRGYDQDGLSAITVLDVPLGGTQVLILNQEVRFPIFKWFKGAAFADAGNTFRSVSSVSLSGLAVGAGLGLRITTPLAPLRIDVALPIGPFGDRRVRWYFSIGQMF
jgi:outer membrane protein assembly factor BamA